MKRRVTPRGMACLLLEFVVLIWVMMHGQHSSRKLPVDSGVVPHCGVASPGHIVWVRYESEYSAYGFYISLHDSGVDSVVSRTIRNTQQYPSVGELHSVCENLRESVDCGPGKVFVEVGASIGMVSLYAASRGMRVYAFDPVLPNVQRLVESVCLNGRVYCAERSNECVNSSEWGPFSPGNFRVLWNLVGSAPKAEQPVRTEPGNLAATMRGGGGYAAEVGMVTLDQFIDVPIEVLLLTCQGFELDSLLGAMHLLSTRRIKSIIWRRHHVRGEEDDSNARQLAQMLLGLGYTFYSLEAARRSADLPPQRIQSARVLEYVMLWRSADEHPNVLAVLE